MNTYADRTIVLTDPNSPDRILARRESWHETDLETDHQFDPNDDGETYDLDGIKGIPRDALRQLLLFLVPRGAHRQKWRQAAVRLAIISRILDIDDTGKETLEKLATQLGVTRSLLSFRQLEIADQFNLGKLRSSKSAAARKAYSISATNTHRTRQERQQLTDSTHIHKTTASRS